MINSLSYPNPTVTAH